MRIVTAELEKSENKAHTESQKTSMAHQRRSGEREEISFSENEKHRTQNQDSDNVRRKDHSKSRERSRKHSGHKGDDNRCQNGAKRCWEKPSRCPEHSRESQRSQDERR
jgi:pre-mRNA-splicing factor CWC22